MPRSLRSIACPFLIVASACNGSPAEPVPPNEPFDNVRIVVAGRVLDTAGTPVAEAFVNVTAQWFCGTGDECQTGTSAATDPEGRFVIRIDKDFQVEFPARAEIQIRPPLGLGYVLGSATVTDLETAFQRIPVADTTFVDVVLPRNSVDSRRPVRILEVGHRTTDLRLDADRLYMSGPGGVAAIDQSTGEWLWQEGSTGGLAGPRYVLVGGTAVMAHQGTLTALRAVDGEVLWSRSVPFDRSLTAGDDARFFASDGSNIAAFDLATGATRWTRELIGSGNVVIAASEDLVCAEILAFVECWEPSTGDPVWSAPTDFANWFAIVGDRVILGAESGWTALDGETGAVLWQTAVMTLNSPAVVERGHSVFGCSSTECLAVRMSDGEIAWRTAIPDPASPATDGESVYVVSWLDDMSSVYVLDVVTGATRERFLPDPFYGGFGGTPTVGEDLVYVYGGLGHLYAFEKP